MNNINKNNKILNVYKILNKQYKDIIELRYSKPIELLVAVILSAQCTDKVVNKVTSNLFKKYNSIYDYANADVEEFKKDIYEVGLFNHKAKNIINACKTIIKYYRGIIPNNIDELTKLSGVGRKTANIILSNIYNINEGIAVDTHMLRVNYRLGFTTSNKNAIKVEKELMNILPNNLWNKYTYLIINHGRVICLARNPKCNKCVLNKICLKIGK